MKLVSIITVNYNCTTVTEQLLSSIYKNNTYPDIEVIVVDNASDPDPVDELRKNHPTVIFIRSEKNLGFAGGNNLGIKHAKGEYLFLVNPDTEFTNDLVLNLVNVLSQNKQVGVVSPKIRFYDHPKLLQYAGFTPMNYLTGQNRSPGFSEEDKGQYDNVTGKTGFAHGAAMMVKREAIEAAGLMAENFFLYYEELDWCERIIKAGFEIWVNMQALIYHKESVSVGKKSALKEYYMNRNRILFERKHATSSAYFIFIVYFLFLVTPRNILQYIKEKQYSFIPILLKAIRWNFTNEVNSDKLYFPGKN